MISCYPNSAKAEPYGAYDIAANGGWINLGINHDTAAFAMERIRRGWHEMGKVPYPAARELLITADCGGSNGARMRLWKRELQTLADEVDDWRGGFSRPVVVTRRSEAHRVHF